MKRLFFALGIVFTILFFTSCGNQNQEAKEAANSKTVLEVAVTPTTFEEVPTAFTLTKAVETANVTEQDGGDCFKGKGAWHSQSISSTVTVTVKNKVYVSTLEGVSYWPTGDFEPGCGDPDPKKERYTNAKRCYEALGAINVLPSNLRATIENGKLTKITLIGKPLAGNLKEPDMVVQLASL